MWWNIWNINQYNDINGPPHYKTNTLALAPSEVSDQPGYPPCLIWVIEVLSMSSWMPGWSVPWLCAHVTWLVLWLGRASDIVNHTKRKYGVAQRTVTILIVRRYICPSVYLQLKTKVNIRNGNYVCALTLYKLMVSSVIQLKINIWASAWNFQQFGILTCVESDEPLQPPFKLRNSKMVFSQ